MPPLLNAGSGNLRHTNFPRGSWQKSDVMSHDVHPSGQRNYEVCRRFHIRSETHTGWGRCRRGPRGWCHCCVSQTRGTMRACVCVQKPAVTSCAELSYDQLDALGVAEDIPSLPPLSGRRTGTQDKTSDTTLAPRWVRVLSAHHAARKRLRRL